ncbi:hypothetical protein HD553DRAFT_323744 [Filobasidium floriforme]|uniref:uncharacterized protein n=1 Tax=Filobasidium floriforme TaxID=5210 RepID=UPI001E8CF5E8|nr:uncharacterized protein HD553DRAFT_323744 [Filobasidium floriforme]KAH8085165.1 hypothetical protein HD553DRAFT_323744 [Filobasidium floriforme]
MLSNQCDDSSQKAKISSMESSPAPLTFTAPWSKDYDPASDGTDFFPPGSNSAIKHTNSGSIDYSTDGEIGFSVQDFAEGVIKDHVNTASRPEFSDQFPNEQDTPTVKKQEHGWQLLHDDLLRLTTQSWPGLWPVEQEAQTVLLDAVAREGQARVQYYMARGRSIHFDGNSRQPPYRSNIHKACQCTKKRIDRILDGQSSGCKCDIGHSPLLFRARGTSHRAIDILQVVALLEAYWKIQAETSQNEMGDRVKTA